MVLELPPLSPHPTTYDGSCDILRETGLQLPYSSAAPPRLLLLPSKSRSRFLRLSRPPTPRRSGGLSGGPPPPDLRLSRATTLRRLPCPPGGPDQCSASPVTIGSTRSRPLRIPCPLFVWRHCIPRGSSAVSPPTIDPGTPSGDLDLDFLSLRRSAQAPPLPNRGPGSCSREGRKSTDAPEGQTAAKHPSIGISQGSGILGGRPVRQEGRISARIC